MGNKILTVVLTVIIIGCDKRVECNVDHINKIYLEGFNSLKINKISFEDLKDQTNNLEYLNPKFDSIDVRTKLLEVDQLTSNSIRNGVIVRINDSLKYKITDVKMEEVYLEKKTMWNAKLYGCSLKEYKLNDSLVESHVDIIIYK